MSVDNCPLCGREMIDGPSINRHHLVPSSRGGKETEYLHRICHDKIHHTFSEKQLEKEYSSIDKLLENEEIVKFVNWVKNKNPEFYNSNHDSLSRKKKRKR